MEVETYRNENAAVYLAPTALGHCDLKEDTTTMQNDSTPNTPQEQSSKPIGQVYLDYRTGILVPTWFTNYLAVPTHHQIRQFIDRLENFYAAHTDNEIALINAEQERLWNEQESDNDNEVKPRKPKGGYVYLLKSEAGHYKIGRTNNPENRMKTFGVKLPFRVEYICLIKCDDMELLEAALHRRFEKKRLDGEWFKLNAKDIDYMKSYAYWVKP